MSLVSEQTVDAVAERGSRGFSLQVVNELRLRATCRLGPREGYRRFSLQLVNGLVSEQAVGEVHGSWSRGFSLQVVNEFGLGTTCRRGPREGVSEILAYRL